MSIAISDTQLHVFRTLTSVDDVAVLLSTTPKRLARILYGQPLNYRTFSIPKVAGGTRTIRAPPTEISAFQNVIHSCAMRIYAPMKSVHGFARGRSVVSNAKLHVKRPWVLNIDLKDFFESINFGRVQGVFRARPFLFPRAVASVLAHICCYNRSLPQGGRTSPVVSNLVCRGLDHQLAALATSLTCRYSRYCDDMTFSGPQAEPPAALVLNPHSRPPILGEQLVGVIVTNDFEVNPAKTRIAFWRQRQEVTGLVVNDKPNVRRSFVREIRGALDSWKKLGEASANAAYLARYAVPGRRQHELALRSTLRGRLAFLSMVRGADDAVYLAYAVRFAELSGEPVELIGSAVANPDIVARAMWVVVGRDGTGMEYTGTAVSLNGLGIVTAGHVFDHAGVTEWVLVPAWKPTEEHVITKADIARDCDLALCTTTGRSPAYLGVGRPGDMRLGQPVNLVGFPRWAGPHDKIRIDHGVITKVRPIAAVTHIVTNMQIGDGSSGGPLLEHSGRVIGIARYGANAMVEPHSAVSASHFSELKEPGAIQTMTFRS